MSGVISRVSRKVMICTLFLTALSSCNSSDGGGSSATDQVSGGSAANFPQGGPPGTNQVTAIGSTCVSSDPTRICLALKYVVYVNSTGAPVATASDALSNLQAINSVYTQCNIAFQIEEFDQVNPAQYGLTFNTANLDELQTIRATFDDDDRFLVVTTGTWDRTGTLGETGANAWTEMPGGGPYGSIIEAAVYNYGPIYAHELGHYLNLLHVSDATNLLDPVIYSNSLSLTQSQCTVMRALATGFWSSFTRLN